MPQRPLALRPGTFRVAALAGALASLAALASAQVAPSAPRAAPASAAIESAAASTAGSVEKAKPAPADVRRRESLATYFQRREPVSRAEREETQSPQIIYGADDRRDVYQVTNPTFLGWAQAGAVVLDSTELVNNGNGTYTLNASRWNSQGGSPLCADEPFRGQFQVGFCSGFLVGQDIAVTAGHCVSSPGDAFVFGFDQLGAGTGPGNDPNLIIPADNVYFVTQVINRALAGGLDHSVVRLDRPVVGRTPLPVRRSGGPAVGEALVMIGHPTVLPKKIDAGGQVRQADGAGTGGTNYFTANVDAYGGNSGSMVINTATGVIEGILVRGNQDFVTTGGCTRSNVCADTGCNGTWEEISKTAPFASFIPELGLSVTPAAGTTHIGVVGGPFTPAQVLYTLNNPTSANLQYRVSIVAGGTAPLTINGGTSVITGTLTPGQSAPVNAALTAAAAGLPAGLYTTTLRFEDLTGNRAVERVHTLEVGRTNFEVTPANGLVTGGPVGGPFTGATTYTLSSTRPTPVTVRITPDQPWVTIDGVAAPKDVVLSGAGASAPVVVGIGGNAPALSAGLYTATVSIANQTTPGAGDATRPVTLEVGRVIYAATDVPVIIPDLQTVESRITVPDGFCLADVDVAVNISHTYVGDLEVDLIAPDGTTVRLHNRTGGGEDNIVATFDDAGNTRVPDGPGALADFNGRSVAGVWTLRVADRANIDTGTINAWSLRVVPLATSCPPRARDVATTTPVNTPANVTLNVVSQNPGALEHRVVSLPASGSLSDPQGGAITTVPYTLLNRGSVVRFTPAPGAAGPVTFTYIGFDGLPSNAATVTVNVGAPQDIAFFNLDTNPGWTTGQGWAFGRPTGGGTAPGDPTAGFTGQNVYGYNLSGDYENNIPGPRYLTTTAINMSGVQQSRLEFRRWLGMESSTFDQAGVQVSNDGVTWTNVWVHNGPTFTDGAWVNQSFDISAVADNRPTVFVRWYLGRTDGSVTRCGWNIDDVRFTGVRSQPPCRADMNSDGELTFDDIQLFVGLFNGSDPRADFNSDGEWTFDDIQIFVGAYNAGC